MREKKCVSEGKRVWNTGAAVFSTRQLSFPCVPCLRAEDRLSFRARQPLREKQGDPEGNTAPTRTTPTPVPPPPRAGPRARAAVGFSFLAFTTHIGITEYATHLYCTRYRTRG